MPEPKCPMYIQVLFILVFILLATSILYWAFSRIPSREGFNANYKFLSSDAPNSPSVEFGITDFVQEAQHVINFVVIDSNLDPSFISFDEYTMPSKMRIDEYYKSVVEGCSWNSGSNSTSISTLIQSANKAMDASYSSFFDPKWLNKQPTNQSIADQWKAKVDIQIDDQLYNTVKYFIIDSVDNKRQCMRESQQSGMTYYFLNSILENKANGELQSTFDKLKAAFYAILRPRFLAKQISTIYWKNQKNLTNSDQISNGSIMYVLGTHFSLIKYAEAINKQDLSESPILSSDKNSTIFTMDSILLYQTAAVLVECARFIKQFERPSDIPSAVGTTLKTFNSGFQAYLDKKQKTSTNSDILFILNNQPDTKSCATGIILDALSSPIV